MFGRGEILLSDGVVAQRTGSRDSSTSPGVQVFKDLTHSMVWCGGGGDDGDVRFMCPFEGETFIIRLVTIKSVRDLSNFSYWLSEE